MVEWRDPPPLQKVLPQPPEWAKELVANPRKWAMIETFNRKSPVNHRQNQIAWNGYVWQRQFSGTWEATYRVIDDEYQLFVRYMP
jgi:hypothetical protein